MITYPNETIEGVSKVHRSESVAWSSHFVEEVLKNLRVWISHHVSVSPCEDLLNGLTDENPVEDAPFVCNDILCEECPELVLFLLEVCELDFC